jgi:anti-sigma regulatory factor (Ser/Thr protein kinase)
MATQKVEVARLLVSELVSNAVRHGSGSVVLVVTCDSGGVRVEVHDESPDLPFVVESGPLMEGGAGLRIVATLASSWGVDPRRDGQPGKRVWFALD